MMAPSVTDVLNELLVRETQSLAPRLFESAVFVSRLSVRGHRIVQRMAQANARHASSLAAMIVRLGGVPGPRAGNLLTADLHFQELRAVVPRLVANQDALVASYRGATGRVSTEPRAARLVAEILAEHERDLADLRGSL